MSAETMQFRTELKQLLHLIVHSLYSHKDIFLRELISNASDAIDRARFQGLTQPEILEGNDDWKIKLIPDEKAGTLTIRDNGLGMSRETIVEQLGTIARSGTREFLESIRLAEAKDRPELIGQFGVGFYSAFMVADRVTVRSRMHGQPEDGIQWVSDGQGSFTVEAHPKETRGTDVILHLKADDNAYLQPWQLRQLVKKYSEFVEHPIVLDVEKEENGEKKTVEETLNARKAIWLRNRAEVTQEEYHEFYKQFAHDTQDPLRTIHYTAEGQVEFKALLYLPAHRPFDLLWGDSNKGLHLYIQRVFILDDAETLLPRYLRFVRGVVDSPDLPLNVSREILQHSAPLEKIKSNLVNKVLATLDVVKRKDFDKYTGFYRELGAFIKEGAYQDYANRERLADLLLFESTKTDAGKQTTLADYVERMPGEQTEIYYLAGESRQILEASPHLEGFRAKGWEVLFLTDPADEIVIDALREFKGKHLKAVDRGAADAAGISEERKQEFQPLLAYLQSKLPDVKEARLTSRLKESAVCLVADEDGYSANLERMMQRMHRDQPRPEPQRVFEVNPEHALVRAVQVLHAKDPGDARLESFARLLYDEALIAEGSKVKDPLDFSRRLNELLLASVEK
jgi:molecular chaperone HtpG